MLCALHCESPQDSAGIMLRSLKIIRESFQQAFSAESDTVALITYATCITSCTSFSLVKESRPNPGVKPHMNHIRIGGNKIS